MADRDILRPHSYDGIQEYDNDLPRWWLATLWLSIIWAVVYIFYYHVEGSPLGPDRLGIEVAQAAEERAKNSSGPLDETLMRELSHNQTRIAHGGEIYAKNLCVTCHGPAGDGILGGQPGPCPNLRDDFWIYGSDMTTLVHTIANGVRDRGMPAQSLANGGQMSDEEILDLACFIADRNRSAKAVGKPHDPDRERETPIAY